LASRLAALDLQLTDAERTELDAVAGRPVRQIVRGLVDAVDPDLQAAHLATLRAAGESDAEEGTPAEARAVQDLLDAAVRPLAENPDLRNRVLELRRTHDRVIDEVNVDQLIDAHGVVDTDRARSLVESFRGYLEQHRSEITALQLLQESRQRRIRFDDIQELADRISRPPHNWTTDVIWNAYAAVDVDRVRRGDHHTLTDLVSLLRYTLGVDAELVPYADRVNERYAGWLAQQAQAGTVFTDAQRWWLDRMVKVIASSAGITTEDLDGAPFNERGGVDGILRDLGDQAEDYLDQLNAELTA